MTDKPRGKAIPDPYSLPHARPSRKRPCIAKRLYDAATPYVQIAGWIPVIGSLATLLYIVCTFIEHSEGYQAQINAANTQLELMKQGQQAEREDIAALRQRADDTGREVHTILNILMQHNQSAAK